MSRDINLSLIDRDNEQPRAHFDADKLTELAQSMHSKGLIVPIMVRPSVDRFIIVHGERRYRAAQSLGWDTIRAEVRDLDATEARWLALIENVQRQDLTPIEEARAYQARLGDGMTQAELGQRIGKSQSYIAQKLRLLTLPSDVQKIVGRGITEGHARQLLRLKDADLQSVVGQGVAAEGRTVSETKELVDMIIDVVLSPNYIFFWQAKLADVCPGIVLTQTSLEFPNDTTPEQIAKVGEVLLTVFPHYEVHEICSMYPMMNKHELKNLTSSIKEIGLVNPITLYEGKILDGKCRYEACRLAGVIPTFDKFPDDYPQYTGGAIAFARSANVHRAHFNESQRACVALGIHNLEGDPGARGV